MLVFRNAETGPQPTCTPSQRQPQGERHGRPVLDKLSFNWNAPDRYVELMKFEMDFKGILERKAFKLTDKEKDPVTKNGSVRRVYSSYRNSPRMKKTNAVNSNLGTIESCYHSNTKTEQKSNASC